MLVGKIPVSSTEGKVNRRGDPTKGSGREKERESAHATKLALRDRKSNVRKD
jgi:hypothetical protein